MAGGKLRNYFEDREKRGHLMLQIGLVLAFLCLLALGLTISFSFLSLAELEMQNKVERAFNNVILAIQNESTSIETVMDQSRIKGVGIYSASGNLLYSRGDVQRRLPLSEFSDMERDSVTNSVVSFDRKTDTMEYLRFLSKAIIPTFQDSLLLPGKTQMINFPNIMYIRIDASDYSHDVWKLRLYSWIGIFSIIAIFICVEYISYQNYRYKQQLVRQESLVSLGQAARTLTHEIKNPLSAITIQLALLKRSLGPENREDLMVIENETKRVIALTNKVSDFLKNPLGQPQRVDLVQAVKELFPLFAHEIQWDGRSPESAIVLFDRDRLRSVFENLLKNAIEACEDGKVDVAVEIKKDRKGFFHVLVKDRGAGISQETEKKIFDPFFTTKIHGSGIGLSISRQFVKAAGGDLILRRREGGGTVVEVTLKEEN